MTKVMTREESSTNKQTMNVSTRGEGFNKKKNELKAFSKKLPKEAELPSVPVTGGLFGWFNYDVTGSDFNRLTESIQDKMIEQNKVLVRTIQEFNTIYDTFSALDKEYIQGILVSLKAAEEANAKAIKGIKGVEVNQIEIKQMINQQKQVIQVLQSFKEKIERIEHLTDVDTIFAIYSTMQEHVTAIETKVEAQELRMADLTDETKSLLSSQTVFQENLNHLKDDQSKQIQTVKQQVSVQNESISKIEAINTENKADIAMLNKEVANQEEKLGDLKQLLQDDIQTLSEKVVRNHSEFETKLDATTNEVSKNKTDLETAMKELNIGIEQQAETMSSYFETELSKAKDEIRELNHLTVSLSKELKTTRIFSFASIAITCVLVLLIISGVL
jgi:DNA repair exonuclease SbcCD ATPase subunit